MASPPSLTPFTRPTKQPGRRHANHCVDAFSTVGDDHLASASFSPSWRSLAGRLMELADDRCEVLRMVQTSWGAHRQISKDEPTLPLIYNCRNRRLYNAGIGTTRIADPMTPAQRPAVTENPRMWERATGPASSPSNLVAPIAVVLASRVTPVTPVTPVTQVTQNPGRSVHCALPGPAVKESGTMEVRPQPRQRGLDKVTGHGRGPRAAGRASGRLNARVRALLDVTPRPDTGVAPPRH